MIARKAIWLWGYQFFLLLSRYVFLYLWVGFFHKQYSSLNDAFGHWWRRKSIHREWLKSKQSFCCLVPTLILSSYLWVGSYFESESHSRSWSSFMPPLRCLLIDSNAPQKSLTRITKLGKQTVSKKHSWNLKTRYAFLRFTMRGFQIGRMMLMSENWNGLESSLMLDSSKLRILMSMNCKLHSIWYVVDTA